MKALFTAAALEAALGTSKLLVKCHQSPGFRDGSSRSQASAKYLHDQGYREVPWLGFQILQHQVALEKVFKFL